MSDGIGLRRLQHLVLWVSDVERSVRFYCDLLGFEVTKQHPNAAFLKIPGTPDDHHLGLFEQATGRPDERGPRMQHGVVDYQIGVSMLQGISTTGVIPLARVPWNDPARLMRSEVSRADQLANQ